MASGGAHRAEWLAQVTEDIIDPNRPIIDTHFHFFNNFGHTYLAEDLLAELAPGHNVRAMVYVEANADFFPDGGAPSEIRFVIEQSNRALELQKPMAEPCQVAAAIVGFADLGQGDMVEDALAMLADAAEGRLRGIRHATGWLSDPGLRNSHTNPPENLTADPAFRRGLKRLADLGYSYDSYQFHPQIQGLVDLAQAVPEASIICDHLAGMVGIGPFSGRHDDIFKQWRKDIADLATCENVVMKLGGMAMPVNGYGWHKRSRPMTSTEYAEAYAPWFEYAIDTFGPDRCMFESNFPVDKTSISYPVLWNGFKRIASRYSEAEQDALFHDTAKHIYRIPA